MDRSLYKRLGDYIEKCEGRNSQGLYGEEDVLGVNNEGNIVKSKAKLHGVDLSPYKIVKNNNFVYNPARLDLGSISLYKGEGCVVSTLYVVFKVREEKEEDLLTDYLDLWLKRKEFHRYVGYVNWGSAREYFWYDNIAEVMIPVPPIEEQRRIVSEYQTVERRIQNNELLIKKLEETTQAIYHHTFVEGIDENNLPEGWRMGCLGEVANIKGGKRLPKGEELIDVPTSHPYIRVADMVDGMIVRLQSDFLYVEEIVYPDISRYIVNEGDIIISIVGTIGKINIIDASLHNANLTENCYKIASDINPYIYCFLKSSNGAKRIEEGIVGGVQAKLPLYNVEAIKIPIPTNDVIKDFNNKFSTIENNIKLLSRETSHLRTLLSLLTSKLS